MQQNNDGSKIRERTVFAYLPKRDMTICIGVGGQVAAIRSKWHGCDGSLVSGDSLCEQKTNKFTSTLILLAWFFKKSTQTAIIMPAVFP